MRYQSALNDTASDRLAEVVAARDRDRYALPLDFDVLGSLDIPVLLIHGVQDVVIPVSRTWELLNMIPTPTHTSSASAGTGPRSSGPPSSTSWSAATSPRTAFRPTR